MPPFCPLKVKPYEQLNSIPLPRLRREAAATTASAAGSSEGESFLRPAKSSSSDAILHRRREPTAGRHLPPPPDDSFEPLHRTNPLLQQRRNSRPSRSPAASTISSA
ncbi:unnamed protein product [Linum trigynum]|uniref:Uncharacterized protein n=1 Tax=Linum trigynum TaxID=586398 RepID=A0AAV2F7A3_9ROSI